jgi:hypothetical protein
MQTAGRQRGPARAECLPLPAPIAMPPLKWRRNIIDPPRDVTAMVLGDPPPGRSALDQRRRKNR